MKRILALPLALCMTTAAWAHNGAEHILGVIASVTGSTLDVKIPSGKITTIATDSKTMWMKGKSMATSRDAHTGDKVIVHAKMQNGKMYAEEVEIGYPAPNTK